MKLRVAGAALVVLCVLGFQPGAATLTQQLLLPIGMALGTALIVRNLLAVLVTAALLGFIQTDWAYFSYVLKGTQPGTEPLAWVTGLAYPLLAGVCLLIALGILSARFRRHIATTRAAREALRSRRSATDRSTLNDTTDTDQERPHEG